MGRRSRTCYLCGQDYQYCPTCTQDKAKPAWMSEFHSESCKNIFDICTRFNMGRMSKEEAQDALNTCDLSNKSNFKSYVQRDLVKIFAEEPKKRSKRIEIKPIDEIMPVVEIAPVVEVEPVIEDTHEVVTIENE